MKAKKEKVTVYSLSDFTSISALEIGETSDFLIKVDQTYISHELFDSYFRSNFFVVFLVTKGEVKININLKQYRAKKNGMIVITPNDLKQSAVSAKTSMLSAIAFTSDLFTKSGMAKNVSEMFNYFSSQYSPLWQLDTTDGLVMETLFDQVDQRYKALKTHPFGNELFYASFHIFIWELAGLGKKYAVVDDIHRSRKEDLVIKFTTLVQQQFKYERSVQRYAAQLNITARHLSETVKEISGRTAGEIIDDFVVQESKVLLGNQQLSIAEVAEELNFCEQSFFGKFFKRLTGVSPRAYRKLL